MPLGGIGQAVGTRARRISGLALYLCGTLLPISAARGTTFTVNTVSDVDDATIDGVCETATGNGTCTLRAAVAEADADPGQPDVIVVPPGIYQIWLGRISVESTTTIAGAGAGLTIFEPAVGGLARGLFFFDGPGHVLALENFTVRNFRALGGGTGVVSWGGSLQVRRCAFESKRSVSGGGAIWVAPFHGITAELGGAVGTGRWSATQN